MSYDIEQSLKRLDGTGGRLRLTAGQTATGYFTAVQALGGNFTYDAGCEAEVGDAPTDGDIVKDDIIDRWPATTIVAKTGTAWVYGEGTIA